MSDRLHDLFEVRSEDLQEVELAYDFQITHHMVLSGGLINTNIQLVTSRGVFVLRVYIAERSRDNIDFEVSTLRRLANCKLAVQVPQMHRGGTYVGTLRGQHFVLLSFVEGKPLMDDHLSDHIAASIGRFIADMQDCLSEFNPEGEKASADLEFLANSVEGLPIHQRWPIEKAWNLAFRELKELKLEQGVVHADIYAGNVIVDTTGQLAAVIDFDDCYPGSIIFDLAIACMAFSFEGAITPNWSRAKVLIDAYSAKRPRPPMAVLYWSIVANCVRFYVYTVPLTSPDDKPEENTFARRANSLIQGDVMAWALAGLSRQN